MLRVRELFNKLKEKIKELLSVPSKPQVAPVTVEVRSKKRPRRSRSK